MLGVYSHPREAVPREDLQERQPMCLFGRKTCEDQANLNATRHGDVRHSVECLLS